MADDFAQRRPRKVGQTTDREERLQKNRDFEWQHCTPWAPSGKA